MGRTSNAGDRLLDSARELMHERGYTAVGVSEVCRRAGVNKGSFYHFFPSKQDLALAVLDRFWEEVRQILDATLEPRDGAAARSPLDRLRRYLTAMADAQQQEQRSCGHQRGCLFGNLALEMSTQDPLLRERVAAYLDLQEERFAKLLGEAVAAGEIPEQDTRASARALLAYVEGSTLMAKAHNRPAVLEELFPGIFRLLGVAQEPARV